MENLYILIQNHILKVFISNGCRLPSRIILRAWQIAATQCSLFGNDLVAKHPCGPQVERIRSRASGAAVAWIEIFPGGEPIAVIHLACLCGVYGLPGRAVAEFSRVKQQEV